MQPKFYFKGLNGIRAIAALAVVFSHVNLSLKNFNVNTALPSLDLAGFGVTIFFSLSGFLITYLLLIEKEKACIDVKNFYLRRILRIWPLYFLYLIAVVFIMYPIDNDMLYYLFFIPNVPFIFGGGISLLHHFWSLGVEEQFYAFWPWLIRFAKNIHKALIIFILLFLILKVAVNLICGGWSTAYTFLYTNRFDCMAIGGLGAYIFLHNKNIVDILKNRTIQVLAWCIVVAVTLNSFHIFSIIDHEIVAFVTVILIVGQADDSPLINLEQPILSFIGKISFGLYIFHPLVIYGLTKTSIVTTQLMGKIVVIHCLVLLITFTLASFSYHYYERYFLRIKDTISARILIN